MSSRQWAMPEKLHQAENPSIAAAVDKPAGVWDAVE
jgi:hypothetical protein